MPTDTTETETTTLSPDDAFTVLGNETRIQILETLGKADEPLSFSELRDRVGLHQGSQFNYHLDKLVGHFVRQTDDGYLLRQAGKRVIKAVLSGAVTEDPTLKRTHPAQWSCPYCEAPAEIGYHQERVWMTCPDCAGTYGESVAPGTPLGPADHGFIGHARLPPAALKGRTDRQVLDTASKWGYFDFLIMASGVCSRCGAVVEYSVHVCEEHDAGDDLCDHCDCRHAVQFHTQCSNCIHKEMTPFVLGRLIATTELVVFLTTHGFNPIAPSPFSTFYQVLLNYDEEVLSTDPFEARFTFTADGDTLTLTVDDDFSVVDVTKSRASEAE